ncbi:hypothetical protein J6590_051059 [Homalodisca vitripennis]|nr:hypothetical protein J6590_051059 [Homalodisca vitripennis]
MFNQVFICETPHKRYLNELIEVDVKPQPNPQIELVTKKTKLEVEDVKVEIDKQVFEGTELEAKHEHKFNQNMNKCFTLISAEEIKLIKEKLFQSELIKTFEEQDREKEHLISSHDKEIKKLKEILNKMKINCDIEVDQKQCLKSTGAQIDISESCNIMSPAHILLELTKLKSRQDNMEHLMNKFQDQLENKTIKPASTPITPAAKRMPRKKYCGSFKGPKAQQNKGKNLFSISMQMVKSRVAFASNELIKATDIQNTTDVLNKLRNPLHCVKLLKSGGMVLMTQPKIQLSGGDSLSEKLTSKLTTQPMMTNSKTLTGGISQNCTQKLPIPLMDETIVTKKNIKIKNPPLNAKVKRTDENYNDFYNNNITFFMEHMKEHYSYLPTNTTTTATAAAPPTLPASQLTSDDTTQDQITKLTSPVKKKEGNNVYFNLDQPPHEQINHNFLESRPEEQETP